MVRYVPGTLPNCELLCSDLPAPFCGTYNLLVSKILFFRKFELRRNGLLEAFGLNPLSMLTDAKVSSLL